MVLLFCLIIVALFCIGTVCAAEVTMKVDSKHIIGSGLGNVPFDLESCINVVYVLSERNKMGSDQYIAQEYPVSIQDYCKVQIGDTVTLEVPDSRLEVCKVVGD